MREISSELKNHLLKSLLTIAKCWKIILNDNTVLGFTNNNKSITFDGQLYSSIIGFENDSINSKLDIECDESEVISILNSQFITEKDLIAGKYDNAKVEIFVINYNDLSMGKVILLTGYLSDIKCEDGKFFAKLNGISNELKKTIGEVFSPLCREELCGGKCGLLSSNYTMSGSVSSISDNSQFYSDASDITAKSQGYFDYGIITFTSGSNNGLSMEIKQFSSGNFILTMEMPYNIAIGDSFNVIAGCDKKFSTCCEKFNNAINFRGEPHLPGVDFMLKSY